MSGQSLPQVISKDSTAGCGTTCGEGLEKIYPRSAIRFGKMNDIGEFEYAPGMLFHCGAKVVIHTERGTEIGQQVSLTCNGCSKSVSREQMLQYMENSGHEFYQLNAGRIIREANPADLQRQVELDAMLPDDLDTCSLVAAQLGLPMRFVTGERLLSGDRIVFYFMADGRIDFRQLVKELSRELDARIHLRQVKARDEARLVADVEICGRECCCKNFLKKLRPVTMRMAKLQKSTLDPSKVSGRCGRLRCCLRYEHETYEHKTAKLPSVNSRVLTDYGEANVLDRQILTELVLVRTDDGREIVVPVEEIRAFDLPGRVDDGLRPDQAGRHSQADPRDEIDDRVGEDDRRRRDPHDRRRRPEFRPPASPGDSRGPISPEQTGGDSGSPADRRSGDDRRRNFRRRGPRPRMPRDPSQPPDDSSN
jgi:cell fate regulator YaaT (PSP1 superfamily)